MSLESFYGGRQGISPVIKAHFTTLDNLTNSFSNPDYTGVWYGEYAIISPDDGSKEVDQENYGKLYRRTYSSPYYEYVGCLKGPAGIDLNKIEFSTLPELRTNFNNIDKSKPDIIHLSGTYNDNNELQYKEKGESDTATTISEDYSANFTATNKEDNIRYAWYNYTNADNQNSVINIGFDIPNFNLDFNEVEFKKWYETPRIAIDDSSSGNFYWRFNVDILNGKPGDYIDNLRVAQVNEFIEDDNTVTLYKWGQNSPLSLITINGVKILDNDILKLKENEYIWVYTYNIYNDNNGNISSKNYYINRIKLINNIQLTENGELRLQYEGEEYTNLGNIKWITEIINSKDENNEDILNQYDIKYNDNSTPFSMSFPYISSVSQKIEEEEGESKNYLKFAQEFGGPVLSTEFNYPEEITFNPATQILSVKYSNKNEEDLTTLNYIKELTLNEENGKIIATHSAPHSDGTIDKTVVGTLKYPTNITFDESTSELAVKYSSVNEPETFATIRYVKEIKLDPKTQILYAKYSTDYNKSESEDSEYGVEENFNWEKNGWTKLGLIRSTMPLSNSSQDEVSQYSGAIPVTAKFNLDKLSIVERSDNAESLTIKDMLSEKIIQFLLNTYVENDNSGFYLFKDNSNKKHIVFVSQKYDNEENRFNELNKYGYQNETQYLFIQWVKEGNQQKNPYYYGLNNLSQYNFSLAGTLLSSGIEPYYALFAYDYTVENNHWFIAGYLNSSTINEDDAIVNGTETSSENNIEPSGENESQGE